MMENSLMLSLQVSVIGMGLVFGAIVLLWGVLSVMVRVLKRRPRPQLVGEVAEHLVKQRAATAAVAIARAIKAEEGKPHEFPLPPTAIVSAWQAVLRSNILNKRGNVR